MNQPSIASHFDVIEAVEYLIKLEFAHYTIEGSNLGDPTYANDFQELLKF